MKAEYKKIFRNFEMNDIRKFNRDVWTYAKLKEDAFVCPQMRKHAG